MEQKPISELSTLELIQLSESHYDSAEWALLNRMIGKEIVKRAVKCELGQETDIIHDKSIEEQDK